MGRALLLGALCLIIAGRGILTASGMADTVPAKIYTFVDQEGQTHYRVFGKFGGADAAFYAVDEEGKFLENPPVPIPAARDIAYYGAGVVTDELQITSDDFSANQTEYSLFADTAGTITVNYTPDQQEGTKNTVLIVTCPEYGASFLGNTASGTFIQESSLAKSNQHIMLIRLKDGERGMMSIPIPIQRVSLSKKHAEQWMDEGVLPATGITARVVTTDVPLRSMTGFEEATGDSVVYNSMTPTYIADYTLPEDTVSSTYQMMSTSIARLANMSLKTTRFLSSPQMRPTAAA